MQSTLHGVNQRLLEETQWSQNLADAAKPEMKETINSIQTKLDFLNNMTQVHDKTLTSINNHLGSTNGADNELDHDGRYNLLKEEILRELENRISLSCSACQSGVENIRHQQQEDRERIRALEKHMNVMEQHHKQTVEVLQRELVHSQSCCDSIVDLERRVSAVEKKVSSNAELFDSIQRQNDYLKETSGGRDSLEERLKKRLRDLERRLNGTVKKAEQKCFHTETSMKELLHREINQIRNSVHGQNHGHGIRISEIEVDLKGLKESIYDHRDRIIHIENKTSVSDNLLKSAVATCAETCTSQQKQDNTEDTVKTLEWRVITNKEEIQRFDTKLNDLSVSGDSLMNQISDLNENVQKINLLMGENGQNFNKIITQVEVLGNNCGDCRSDFSYIEDKLNKLKNTTSGAFEKCQSEITSLQRRVESNETTCSKVCSNLQEEVGILKEEVEKCQISMNEHQKHLNSQKVITDGLKKELRSIQGEHLEVSQTCSFINDTLKGLGHTIQIHDDTITDLGSSKDRIFSEIDNVLERFNNHVEDSQENFDSFGRDLQTLNTTMFAEMVECRRVGEETEKRFLKLENVSSRMDLFSKNLLQIKDVLNRQVSGLWTSVSGLNVTVITQGTAIDDIENVHLENIHGKLNNLNSSLLHMINEFQTFIERDFTGE